MKISKHNNSHYLELQNKSVEINHYCHDFDEIEHYLGAQFLIENNDACTYSDIADIEFNKYPNSLCLSIDVKNNTYEPFFHFLIAKRGNKIFLRGYISYSIDNFQDSIHPKKIADLTKTKLKELNAFNIEGPILEDSFYFLEFSIELSQQSTLEQEVLRISTFLANAQTTLISQFNIFEGITTKINIPNEYKHTFGQYLAYFGEFLADLGIDADTSITTKKNELLLSINPNNKDEAIENIYLALASYLSLADDDSETFLTPTQEKSSEMKLQQLMFQVSHLKSQLKMTGHIASLQEKHINLLEASAPNNQTVLINNESKNQIKKNEYWEPVKGIKITTYKGKFFEIDIPTLIRKFTKK